MNIIKSGQFSGLTVSEYQSEGGDARTGYEASRAHGLSGLACAGDLVVVARLGPVV